MSNPFLPLLPSLYPGDDWNVPPPRLPAPDIQSELLPATAPSDAVLPDETPGNWQPYAYQAAPAPETLYNPYPVQPELSIKQIVDEKMA
jgi:hypothetical protein